MNIEVSQIALVPGEYSHQSHNNLPSPTNPEACSSSFSVLLSYSQLLSCLLSFHVTHGQSSVSPYLQMFWILSENALPELP